MRAQENTRKFSKSLIYVDMCYGGGIHLCLCGESQSSTVILQAYSTLWFDIEPFTGA